MHARSLWRVSDADAIRTTGTDTGFGTGAGPSASLGSGALAPAWSASPWRTRRGRTIAVATCAVAFAALVGLVAADWLWCALALVVFLLVTIDAFVPTRYATDAAGLAIHGALRSRRMRWSQVKHVALDPAGDAAFLATGTERRPRGATVLLDTPERGEWLLRRVAPAAGTQAAPSVPGQ